MQLGPTIITARLKAIFQQLPIKESSQSKGGSLLWSIRYPNMALPWKETNERTWGDINPLQNVWGPPERSKNG
jgi:hypothetical protein